MANKRGRKKGEPTTPKSARVKTNLLEKALRINSDFSHCCNKGLELFIESGEFEIRKK